MTHIWYTGGRSRAWPSTRGVRVLREGAEQVAHDLLDAAAVAVGEGEHRDRQRPRRDDDQDAVVSRKVSKVSDCEGGGKAVKDLSAEAVADTGRQVFLCWLGEHGGGDRRGEDPPAVQLVTPGGNGGGICRDPRERGVAQTGQVVTRQVAVRRANTKLAAGAASGAGGGSAS